MKLLNKLFGQKIVVRMAPSPTGNLHIGTARTTLFNYLFARHNGGKFIMRIEDTDKERSTKEFEKNIIDGLAWLGLSWDEFYRQSERTDVYVSFVKKMIANGSAYISKEEPKEEGSPRQGGTRRSEVVRFKNPNKKIIFKDLIRGEVEFDTTELGDFVIAKSPEEPLYHLAVVVDDHVMGVTHVIRGEDHISNTPRQILIQEAIGAKRPAYAHLPLILGADRSKMSKRHGATSIDEYKSKGYLPQSITNYLALLGWNPGTEQEIFTLEQLIKEFDIEKTQKGGAIFDIKKLDWIQKEHVKLLPKEEQLTLVKKNIENESYMKDMPAIDPEKLSWKATPREETREHLRAVLPLLESEEKLMKYAEEKGRGNVLWPLRFALTGAEKSPDPFTLIQILGVDEAKARVERAIALL